jgi:hypothetical protein
MGPGRTLLVADTPAMVISTMLRPTTVTARGARISRTMVT